MAKITINPYADGDEHSENRLAPPGFATAVNTDKRDDYAAEQEQGQQQAEERDPEYRQYSDAEARQIATAMLWNEREAGPNQSVDVPDVGEMSEADQAAVLAAKTQVANEQDEQGNQLVASHLTTADIAAVEKGETVERGDLVFRENVGSQFTARHKNGVREEVIDIDRVKEIVTEREKDAVRADPKAEAKHEVVSQTFKGDEIKAMQNGETVKQGDKSWKIEDGQLKGENKDGGKASYNAALVAEKVEAREAERAARIEARNAAKTEKTVQSEQTKNAAFDLSSKDVQALHKGETVAKGPMQYQRDGKEIVASLQGAPEQGTRIDGNTLKGAVEQRERAQTQIANQMTPAGIAKLEKGETVSIKGIECQKRGDMLQAKGQNGTKHDLKFSEVKGQVAEREMTSQVNKKMNAARTGSEDRTNAIRDAARTSQEASASKKVNAEPTKVERLRDMGEGATMTEKSGNIYKFDSKTNELVRHDPNGKEIGRKPFEEVKNAELSHRAQQSEKAQTNAKANDQANDKTPPVNNNVDAEEKKPTTKERRKALAEERKATMSPEQSERVNAIKAAAQEGKEKSAEKEAAKNAEPTKAANEKQKEDEFAK